MRLYILIANVFLYSFTFLNGIYDYHFTTIEGKEQLVSEYQERKMVWVMLPVSNTQANTTYLQRLDSISKVYENKAVLIGVPSYEDGYRDDSLSSLTMWYRSVLHPGFVIAKGMYTRKSSLDKQHPIFQWLTDKNQNGHFDREVEGVGMQFYISEEGTLDGVFGPEAKMSNKVLQLMLD